MWLGNMRLDIVLSSMIANTAMISFVDVLQVQEKLDELQMELDSTKLDLEHAQLNAKENEAAARALRCACVP